MHLRNSVRSALLVFAAVASGCGDSPARLPQVDARGTAPVHRAQPSCGPDAETADPASLERRGYAYIDAARADEDDAGYLRALACARAMAERAPGSLNATFLLGYSLHNLHRFDEAEPIARRLVGERGLAQDWALLGDALVELGRLDEAEVAYQRMIDLRPDAGAYVRIAEFRALIGDDEGARELLRWAARAVSPRTPGHFAWIWARLADYELMLGDPDAALAIVERARQVAPNSALAQRVYARILKERT